MNTSLFSPTALQVNEYLLVISPSEDLSRQVMEEKVKFAADYDCEPARQSHQNITLINFMQHQMNEERILHRLKTISETHVSFKVALNGFGSFPTHTIYFNIPANNQIEELVRSFMQLQRWLRPDNEHKPHFTNRPYLTLARKLVPLQYEKAWKKYKDAVFNGTFIADQLLLLKKKQGDHRYQVILTLPLQSATEKIPILFQQTLF